MCPVEQFITLLVSSPDYLLPGSLKWQIIYINFIVSPVCRLLEQEKMSHSDLKQTWEMANVQFVENLRVQEEAFSRVWNILTPDQRTTVQQQQQPQVGQLIDLQSPQTSPQPTNQQVVYFGLEKERDY